MEEEFFIREYIGDSRSEIKCILKQRYSDFIVNEITPNEIITEISRSEDCINVERKPIEAISTIDTDIELPIGVSEQLMQQIDTILSDTTKLVNIPAEEMDKLGRTRIHEWIRKRYQGKLNSQTRNGSIVVSTRKNDNRKRKIWPEGRPDYLHFTMSKENKDSHYALSLMAKFLGIKASNFGICGTKDRRGVTSQRVSVYRIDADRVRALNSRLRGIRLSDFEYCAKPCALGQLWGNQFRIILRCISGCEDAELCARVEDFKCNGFINYFGTQRFGSCGVATAEVGRAIIKKQYEEAVRTILKQRPALGCLREALEEWNKSGDAALSVKKLSGGQAFASIEAQLLSSLAKSKGNFSAALMRLPRNTRSLYVHAYQSLVWNKIASRRMKEFGYRVIEGDIDENGVKVENDDPSAVALPLPSSKMRLPENDVGKWYSEYMDEDGVTSDMFKSLESQYALGDILRQLVVKPKDVEYEILKYPDKDTRLQPDLNGEYDKKEIGSGEFRALSVKFALPSGSYATVALRQLTRTDMGKAAQSMSADDDDANGEMPTDG
uniref:TRUD domain-containing protein n=1 Tax=Parascaris univalens TaxID=6257 RepID=A0A915B911_PARUN